MILSDKSIKKALKKGFITISDFDESSVQPSSYDLHLGNSFLEYKNGLNTIIDVKEKVDDLMQKVVLQTSDTYIIHPHQFVLGVIKEKVGVDAEHAGRLEGKSSLARLGLIIHATAGFLDPGNTVNLTLEMYNLSPYPIKLYVGMKIAQITFHKLDTPCEKPYGSEGLNSKYLNDYDVKGSQMWKNFE